MKGTIYHTNKTRGMYSVKIDNLYIVIEDLDGVDLNYGDIISGIPDGEGSAELKNLESGESFSAIVQNTGLDENTAYRRTMLI